MGFTLEGQNFRTDKFFLKGLNPFEKEVRNESGRVASRESTPVHFNVLYMIVTVLVYM